ncbi:hypothetical protein E2C01_014953 [Portunus trituberculatus]|uniref:Uncharacterized protein n=1 Tax=Portunus trituberculatus TaxID=210409 RepID=A0A5B7DLJ2_PORTR|nr:hypothetical protein [Portunus trituberculatus]
MRKIAESECQCCFVWWVPGACLRKSEAPLQRGVRGIRCPLPSTGDRLPTRPAVSGGGHGQEASDTGPEIHVWNPPGW